MSDYFSNPLAMNFNTGFTNSNPSMVNFGGNAATGAPAWSANQINSSMGFGPNGVGAQNQALLNNLYGPQGFGGATAQAAATGAAYGRATGGFGGLGAANADPFTPVPSGGGGGTGRGGSNPFTSGAPAVPYFDTGGGAPFGGGGFGRPPTVFDTGAQGIPNLSGGGVPFGGGGFGTPQTPQQQPITGPMAAPNMQRLLGYNPNQSPQGPGQPPMGSTFAQTPPVPPFEGFNNPFARLRGGGDPTATQMQNQPAIDAVLGFQGRGTGVGADAPPSAPPSPWEHAFNSLPSGEGSFADRFSPFMRGRPGQPSEYTTSPYTDVGGTTHQPNIPSGYQTPFSADNPGGALTRGMRQGGGAPPVMGGDSEDTLTAQDAAIPFGPRGSFDPSAFNAAQYQPGSPFGSGQTAGRGAPTQTPFFGGEGSGFGAPGSMQATGQHGFRSGGYPALVGASQDQYGNPFIQGNAPPFAAGAGRMGGGVGYGGLDALGQGTVFRGIRR